MSQAAVPPLEALPGIGAKAAAGLREAGVGSPLDLLYHLPVDYEDRRDPRPIGAVEAAGRYALRGRLEQMRQIRLRGRRTLVRGLLSDDTGSLAVRWLNRPFLLRQVREGEPVLLYGEVAPAGDGWSMTNGSLEKVEGLSEVDLLVPVYRSLGGLGPGRLRRVLARLLQPVEDGEGVPWLQEPLPGELLLLRRLPPLPEALMRLHRPHGRDGVEALRRFGTPAHGRLVYGEVLDLLLTGARVRELRKAERKRLRYRPAETLPVSPRDILPFEPTAAQQRVFEEIVGDLERPQPMRRLLQGDVGSGKTAVAAQALAVALGSGHDAVYMAPTQLLAEQHFLTFRTLLGRRFEVRLEVAGDRCRGEPGPGPGGSGGGVLHVGTHALLEEKRSFRDLALAVIDEQHRFGVRQRQGLLAKGEGADLLVLSATPIPRSLTLTHYGDLDLSVLDELPPGRRPIRTELVPRRRRRGVWKRLREEVAAGGQAFVVYPAIDGGRDDLSLTGAGEAVKASLPPGSAAVVHGRMEARLRAEIMDSFGEGRLRVLLATTVVEVGVDVPGASLMIIEGAETFGLAQLHQLRGRVGRGPRPSVCLAVHGKLSASAQRRLEAFASTQDGFRLAEEDLALRGPGDLFGSRAGGPQSGAPGRRQSGSGAFRVADPVRDRSPWSSAAEDAAALEPLLARGAHRALRDRIETLARGRFEAGGGG